jgi:uncharacterized membrane protein YeiB
MIAPIGLLLFMPWDPSTKALVGVAISAVYVVVPVAVISFLLSEKRWLRMTGTAEVLRKLVG